MLLVRIFGNVGQMEAEGLAKATEFNFALTLVGQFAKVMVVEKIFALDDGNKNTPGKSPLVVHYF